MQNRFGLKDFFTMALLVVVIIMLGLVMLQRDRSFEKSREVQIATDDLKTMLATLMTGTEETNARLGSLAGTSKRQADNTDALLAEMRGLRSDAAAGRLEIGEGGGATTTPAVVTDGGSSSSADERDESWARPGIPVTWSRPWTYSTDPASMGGKPGGTFIEIYEGQMRTATPARYADVYGRRINDMVLEPLGAWDPKTLELRGRLAQAWQYAPDGTWLRVKIHPRARFSDGMPVTGEDVRFSLFDVILNPEIEADRERSVYNNITAIDVLSEKVVEFHFKDVRYDSMAQAFGFYVMPKHFYEKYVKTPQIYNQSTGLVFGSGPFKLASFDPERQWSPPADLILERNDLYWAPAKPMLDGYRIKSISDSFARFTEFMNGNADFVRPISNQFATVSEDPEFIASGKKAKKWLNMRSGYAFLAWQCGPRKGEKLTPFHDKRVRQAMTHLIDRDRVIRDIRMGIDLPCTGPFSSATPQADPAIEPWPFDPVRADELLREAGWVDRDKNGVRENEKGEEFRFEITYPNGSESTEQMVKYVKQACAEMGIRCELKPIDWSILQPILDERDFDCVTFAWSASQPESDPEQLWHSKWINNQGDNWIQWNSPTADALIEEGRKVLVDAERMKVWHKLHRHIHEEQPYTFMFEMPWIRLASARAGNVQEYRSGMEWYEFFIRPGGAPVMP